MGSESAHALDRRHDAQRRVRPANGPRREGRPGRRVRAGPPHDRGGRPREPREELAHGAGRPARRVPARRGLRDQNAHFAAVAPGKLRELGHHPPGPPERRNFAEVVAERIQRFISQRGQGSGNMQIAIDHRIEIEIRAADLVDIDLLDLPGIVSMPQDVKAASEQLTRDYLQKDNTLALCVVDDKNDSVRSSQALGEIGRVDGLGARTIVVLTKVDMLQGQSPQQNPARLAHRLANPADTVGFEPTAFIPVINRGEHDGKSLTDALVAEEATFAEWKRTTPGLPADDRLGLTGVLNALNLLIKDHIRKNWLPKQLDKATRRLQEVQKETASLGALSVSSELFLDRLCEVVSEKLAKFDGSTSSGLPSDIKVWSFDWMTALSFPANCDGPGRFNRVRCRMRAKAGLETHRRKRA